MGRQSVGAGWEKMCKKRVKRVRVRRRGRVGDGARRPGCGESRETHRSETSAEGEDGRVRGAEVGAREHDEARGAEETVARRRSREEGVKETEGKRP